MKGWKYLCVILTALVLLFSSTCVFMSLLGAHLLKDLLWYGVTALCSVLLLDTEIKRWS